MVMAPLMFSTNDSSKFCRNLLEFDPVNPEFTRLVRLPNRRIYKNWYLADYLSKYWTDHPQTLRIVRQMGADDSNLTFGFCVVKRLVNN